MEPETTEFRWVGSGSVGGGLKRGSWGAHGAGQLGGCSWTEAFPDHEPFLQPWPRRTVRRSRRMTVSGPGSTSMLKQSGTEILAGELNEVMIGFGTPATQIGRVRAAEELAWPPITYLGVDRAMTACDAGGRGRRDLQGGANTVRLGADGRFFARRDGHPGARTARWMNPTRPARAIACAPDRGFRRTSPCDGCRANAGRRGPAWPRSADLRTRHAQASPHPRRSARLAMAQRGRARS